MSVKKLTNAEIELLDRFDPARAEVGLGTVMKRVQDNQGTVETNLTSIQNALRNRVDGLFVKAPTSASTQATGTGAYDYNVDIESGFAVVDGVLKSFAPQADFDLDNGGTANLTTGQSIVYALVAKNVGGAVSLDKVAGTAATTGSEAAPTDAEIDTALGVSTWVRLADVTINRTGDTTLTQSQDNDVRAVLAALTPLS